MYSSALLLSVSAPPAYLSPMPPTTPVSVSSPSVAPSPLNTSTSSLSNTSSTSTSPGNVGEIMVPALPAATPTPTATPKKKGGGGGGGRKRDAQQQQGGPPKKAKVSRYFLLAPGCTQDDYSKKGAKPGKPRKNDKHLPVDIRWVLFSLRQIRC